MHPFSYRLWLLIFAVLLSGPANLLGKTSLKKAHPLPKTASAASTTLPATPSGLSGIFDTNSNMKLTWHGANGATNYLIERQNIGTGTWSTLTNVTAATYTDPITNRARGGWAYRVSASNSVGTSAPTGVFPSARYVVIDLGANKFPIKLTNSGYVLMYNDGTNYSCFVNGTNMILGPKQSGDKFHVFDITEDGVAVGEETTATNTSMSDPLIRTGIEKWTLPTGTDTNMVADTPDYNAGNGDAGSDGTTNCDGVDAEFYYGDGQFFDNTTQTPSDPVHRTLARGYYIDAAHHIWSNRYITLLTNTPVAILDGYMDTNRLGTINSNGTGKQVEIIAVTPGGKALLENDIYSNSSGGADPISISYSLKEGTTNTTIAFFPKALNDARFVIGQQTNSPYSGIWWPGSGPVKYFDDGFAPTAINKAMSGTLPAYQAADDGYLREMNPKPGSVANATFKPRIHLNDALPPDCGWSNFARVASYVYTGGVTAPTPTLNDGGAIVGTATYVGSDTNIASGSHGVLLLPCEFRLLNGATNGTDGMDFNGNRPTTISATSPYARNIATNALEYNQGTNVIGKDLPLGVGRVDFPGECYTYSLMMLAKVSPQSATNITYGWNRVYQDRSITIAHTTTNTWYVTVAASSPTGVPTPEPDSSYPPGTDKNVIPSANGDIVVFYDNPAMHLSLFTNTAPSTNDYAYEKTDYTYFLTNSIGSVYVTATQHVGQILIAKRIGTSGVIANDWAGISNIVSTTNIPNCLTVSTNEIRGIVSPSTNIIIFDSSIPTSP